MHDEDFVEAAIAPLSYFAGKHKCFLAGERSAYWSKVCFDILPTENKIRSTLR